MNIPSALLTTTLAAVSLLAFSPLSAETAFDIAAGFEKQKIEALEGYIVDNPEAEDLQTAYAILIDSHQNLGKEEAIPDLIIQRYELLETGADANLQLLASEIVRPIVAAADASGQREKAKAFLARLKTDLESNPQGPQFAQFIDQVAAPLSLPGVGEKMEIAFTSMSGDEVDLSKMKDKVVLVDFWATWCRPCVAEMPNVIAASEKYGEKGFEVIGISLDEDRAAVESFVEEYGMKWPQYFDGKGWGNEIAQQFGISSIPATFLLGKDGTVVASNLHGPALAEAIEEALK